MAAKQAMKENLQCTSKFGHLRISQDICHARMTDIEGFLAIYGHSDNLLNNNCIYARPCVYNMTCAVAFCCKVPVEFSGEFLLLNFPIVNGRN